ncbi:2-oxoglutarate dehydrogenase, E2 component, dihydrolipoamide succinyltransferase [Modestobacter sp. I12A-02628]|uniref:Dihydrolipoamide acetyltransferase component of pyruvate dehydrogenase complex n=1 Tax=Goekera deserti TaxID=2497753 RepID=A0A7K3WCL5_9ACTN|nr:2-oxoglutarate dehydrogenase, E2 component, dihydrolipoamide succinyltransferase [Goekera deserti]MPQ97633.1 2-oxoglutarate dehydrogenase, E2 component, dihydrolipoamide succinyltransferase [Goekera deserti]NDI47762.1 2-oxoglutarate dehydrogenase, E2 component, dihydrolipoamide succinyltransferase [Goekera deserti]NEL53510.1 2-oxoglutarate dehydrogenase, E2 component, dihydrolipoamide succinyltransferase [Goekera deserti]
MPTSVTMPALGESVTEGTVTRWLKQEGDQVEVDEPLLEVSTDKVDTEIPSPAAGVLSKIVVAEDETVEVGAELAVIGGDSDAPAEPAPAQQAEPEAVQPEPAAVAEPEPARAAAPAEAPPTGGDDGSDSTPVTMPALGESVTEGTVTRWLKAEGDTVEVDEPLLEVSTDKVDTEIPSPAAGVLRTILVAEDETVEVGAQLALIGGSAAAAPQQAVPAAVAKPAAEKPAPAEQPAAPARSVTPADVSTDGSGTNDYSGPDAAAETTQAQAPPQAAAPAPSAPAAAAKSSPTPVSSDGGSAYVTPLVRRLAADSGVDLASVTGTGVGGRIRKQDVLAAAESSSSASAPAATPPAAASAPAATSARTPSPAATQDPKLRGRTEKMSRLRTVIAKRMVESLQVSAQLTTVVEADVTRIARLRDQVKGDFAAREGVKLSFLPFFAKAAIEALAVHPSVNSSIDMEAGTVTYHDAENLGVAVDTERGLLVPVIKGAGDLSLAGIARKIADLAERTRTNKITPDELGGGTFTLTNTGSRGALFDTPIINQPQVAILGVGSVVKRPMVVTDPELGEVVAVRSMVYLALSYDHRIVDGADAARFLTTVRERLEGGSFHGDVGLA